MSVVAYTLNSVAWATAGWFAAILNYRLKLLERWRTRRDRDDETET